MTQREKLEQEEVFRRGGEGRGGTGGAACFPCMWVAGSAQASDGLGRATLTVELLCQTLCPLVQRTETGASSRSASGEARGWCSGERPAPAPPLRAPPRPLNARQGLSHVYLSARRVTAAKPQTPQPAPTIPPFPPPLSRQGSSNTYTPRPHNPPSTAPSPRPPQAGQPPGPCGPPAGGCQQGRRHHHHERPEQVGGCVGGVWGGMMDGGVRFTRLEQAAPGMHVRLCVCRACAPRRCAAPCEPPIWLPLALLPARRAPDEADAQVIRWGPPGGAGVYGAAPTTHPGGAPHGTLHALHRRPFPLIPSIALTNLTLRAPPPQVCHPA